MQGRRKRSRWLDIDQELYKSESTLLIESGSYGFIIVALRPDSNIDGNLNANKVITTIPSHPHENNHQSSIYKSR